MAEKTDKMIEAYYEKPGRISTWSGLPLEEVYTPEDLDVLDYATKIADPGEYPFTRGIFRNMYRGRYWTRREVTGYGTPSDTNKRLKYQIEQGVSGLNVIIDVPTNLGLDSDHPLAGGEVGVQGVPLTSLRDMEYLMEDVPMDKLSMSLIVSSCITPACLSMYIALAKKRGIDPATLSGTVQNDPLHTRYCGIRASAPLDLAYKTAVDTIEYCTRNMPKWYPINVNLYDIREQGVSAPQEVAFGLSMARLYVQGVLNRGLGIDDFAPRIAFYCSAHIDFFEEIAKLRAARRLWARIMKEEFGAKDPRSWRFRFGIHTAGCSLVSQQPLNNIIRVAYEALVAVLAGVQSLHCCSYDEPIALPTEEAVRIAIRTQQILAYETGVANVSDPLGGSYYIETLTDRIEDEARRIMAEIDSRGGMMECLRTEWIDREMEKAALAYQKEVERGERKIVGVNVAVESPEECTPGGVHRIPAEAEKVQVENLRKLRAERHNEGVDRALLRLARTAEQGEKINLVPAMIEAAEAYATLGEILGTVRMAMGFSYDPFGKTRSPACLSITKSEG